MGVRRPKTIQIPAVTLPGCNEMQSRVVQLRARGLSYREVGAATKLGPRKASDVERLAMRKLVRFLETESFMLGRNR